ncbi:hypothetical protein NHP20013_02430 [Helicobacter bizzozeronii]|nr:hypothetical protein NHP20013_02430 [Helicobacter bizzozeronii]
MPYPLLAFVFALVFYGCKHAPDPSSEVTFSYYEESEKQQPKNHLLILLAPMEISFSSNVPESMQKEFKASMLDQIQSILEKRGFSVEVVDSKPTPKQAHDGYMMVRITGAIDVLEELDMSIFKKKDNGIGKRNKNLSMGFLELRLLEPKSQKVLQMSALELPGYQIKTDVTIQQQRTTGGGFMPTSVVTPVHGSGFDSHVYQILLQIYTQGVSKVSHELTLQKLEQEKYLIQKAKQAP